MFAGNTRKHARDSDDDHGMSGFGFSEHRTKRHIANLPHRISPKLMRSDSPFFGTNYTTQSPAPPPPTITPVDSDCEEAAAITGPKTFFSPYCPRPSNAIPPTSPRLGAMNNSQTTDVSDVNAYAEDHEMEDSVHLSPGPFQSDPSLTITGRIPTPIHSQFSAAIRSDKLSRPRFSGIDEEDACIRNRRLPSPISEGESTSEMPMDVDIEKETPTKKGHSRSKHSVRQWGGYGGDIGPPTPGLKRNFTIGYRADCEKCRNKVVGHNAHIITY